ncbi:MAG TPA: hypothetical protein VKH63_13705 [Candidatus Acidoferrum sp.]|jgi:hypothetical protein|nr:hypothetical protein [Candidatus Acidoferrum sp.]
MTIPPVNILDLPLLERAEMAMKTAMEKSLRFRLKSYEPYRGSNLSTD